MAELAALGALAAEAATAAGTAAAGAVGEIGLGTALSAGSSLVGGVAADAAGKAQAKAAKTASEFQSEQLTAAGAEAKAKAGRKAEEIRHKTMVVAGRNEAVASASGAGTGGSNAQTLEDIYAEGQYQAQSAVASGENIARGLKDKDAAQQYDAKMAANMAKAKGTAGLVSGVLGAGGKVMDARLKSGALYDDPEKKRLGFTPDDEEDAYPVRRGKFG